MANADFTQKDTSRFQLRSYGWRDIDINSDRAITLLEQAFQSGQAIEGIASMLRNWLIDAHFEEGSLNANQLDRLLAAIEQLSGNLTGDVCRYASHIEKMIEDRNATLKARA